MSVTCRRALACDREALSAIWQEAFGDTPDEIGHFLDTFDYVNTAFVVCEDDRVCSMLFLLPTAVADGNRRYPVGYVYAGATKVSARSKGYYRRLLTFVADTAKQEGMTALLLRPASRSLAEGYRRMGFTVPLYGNSRPSEATPIARTLTAAQYGDHRRERLRGRAFVDWDDRTLRYALSWCSTGLDETALVLFDGDTVWESLPTTEWNETALLMPFTDELYTTAPIWFGYGLE